MFPPQVKSFVKHIIPIYVNRVNKMQKIFLNFNEKILLFNTKNITKCRKKSVLGERWSRTFQSFGKMQKAYVFTTLSSKRLNYPKIAEKCCK